MSLRRQVERLQEEQGRHVTRTRLDHAKVQALEESAKELDAGLEALSAKSKAKDDLIAELEAHVAILSKEKKAFAKSRDQAVLDARRALSSINSSGKNARSALQHQRMAEEDRDAAHKQMVDAQSALARAEAVAMEAISERDRVLLLKADVDARAAENDRIRSDLHDAHAAQTRAEAERFAAIDIKSTALAEAEAARAAQAAAESDMEAAQRSQHAAEAALSTVKQELDAKTAEIAELQKIQATRDMELAVWKRRAVEAEAGREAEEDRFLQTTEKFSHMRAKLVEAFDGYSLAQAEIQSLQEQLEEERKREAEWEEKLKVSVDERARVEEELALVNEEGVQAVVEVRCQLEARIADLDAENRGLKSQLDASAVVANGKERARKEAVEVEAAVEEERKKMEGELQEAVSMLESERDAALLSLHEAVEKLEEQQAEVLKMQKEIEESKLLLIAEQEVHRRKEDVEKELASALAAVDASRMEVEEARERAAEDGRRKAAEVAALEEKVEELAVLAEARSSSLEELETKNERLKDLNSALIQRLKEGKAAAAAAASTTTTTTTAAAAGSSDSNKMMMNEAAGNLSASLQAFRKSTEFAKGKFAAAQKSGGTEVEESNSNIDDSS